MSPIRSSDRRKIADQIITAFDIEIPATESTNLDEHETATAASGLGDLRNSLLPEGSLSARFTTTAGPKLSPVSGIIYVGPFDGREQRVLWFKIDEKLIPTGQQFAKTIGFDGKQPVDTRNSLHIMEASGTGPSTSHAGPRPTKATNWC